MPAPLGIHSLLGSRRAALAAKTIQPFGFLQVLPANALTADFELGTLGNDILVTDTGSASKFDTRSVPGDAIAKYDNTHALGLVSAHLSNGTSNNSASLGWSTQFGPLTEHNGRVCAFMPAFPTGNNFRIVRARQQQGSILSWALLIDPTGKLNVIDENNKTQATTIQSLPTTNWFEIVYHVIHDHYHGFVEVFIYNQDGSLVDSLTVEDIATNFNASLIEQGLVAPGVGFGNNFDLWIDGVVAASPTALSPIPYIVDTDTGSASDNQSETAVETDTDIGAGSDTQTQIAVSTNTDTGSGSDSQTTTAVESSADTGSGANNQSETAVYSNADSGAGSDSQTPKAVESSTDTSSGSDSQSETVVFNNSDSGTGSDSGSSSVPVSTSDTGAGTDTTGPLTASEASSDSGVGGEAQELTAAYSSLDVSFGLDANSLIASYLSNETGFAFDDQGLLYIILSDDLGFGSDSGTTLGPDVPIFIVDHDFNILVVERAAVSLPGLAVGVLIRAPETTVIMSSNKASVEMTKQTAEVTIAKSN